MDRLPIVLFTAFLGLRPTTAKLAGTERFEKVGYPDYTGGGSFDSRFLCFSQGRVVDAGTVLVIVVFLIGCPALA